MLEKAQRPEGARLSWEIARRCVGVCGWEAHFKGGGRDGWCSWRILIRGQTTKGLRPSVQTFALCPKRKVFCQAAPCRLAFLFFVYTTF